MKTLWVIILLCSLIAVPAFSQVSLTTEDLDKIRLIVNDVVKKEIADSEARMKDYVNVRFDSIEKRFEGIENDLKALKNKLRVLING